METSTAVSQPTIYSSNYAPSTDSKNSSRQQTTVSTSRGCTENNVELTLVAPENYIAQTSATHPTFLFYLSSIPSRPLRVSVTEPNVVKSIFEQDFTVKKAGFYAISIPKSQASLESGKTYVLTFGILCNPSRPSQSSYASVAFQKVDLSFQASQQLIRATNELQRAQIYDGAEIWYDAIAASYRAQQKSNPSMVAYFNKLLKWTKISTSSTNVP